LVVVYFIEIINFLIERICDNIFRKKNKKILFVKIVGRSSPVIKYFPWDKYIRSNQRRLILYDKNDE